jgi:hypothetical protein
MTTADEPNVNVHLRDQNAAIHAARRTGSVDPHIPHPGFIEAG